MTDRLDAVLDHVAIAVPTWEGAERRWKEQLGGGVVAFGTPPAFRSRQLRFANRAKLELLAPPEQAGPDNFVRRFLERFGAQVHHVTLKVPDLALALETLAAAGEEPVDVRMDNPYWHEAFLRPSRVGGLVVQIAWAATDDEEWAARVGHQPEEPRADAPDLLGPVLRHPDLSTARALWELLGAEVVERDGELACRWPRSSLTVWIAQGAPAGPLALRIAGGPSLPADPEAGPDVRSMPRMNTHGESYT